MTDPLPEPKIQDLVMRLQVLEAGFNAVQRALQTCLEAANDKAAAYNSLIVSQAKPVEPEKRSKGR